jgi:hypothetical protein
MGDDKIQSSGSRIAESIRDHMQYSNWKAETLRQHFSGCESVQDLVDKCGHEEPNVRIVAAWLLRTCDLNAWECEAAIQALEPLLKDERTNELASAGGCTTDDEGYPTPQVAAEAAAALDRLKPNWRPRPPK